MNEPHSCNACGWHLCIVFGAKLTFCILIIIGKMQSACLWEMFKKGTTLQVWGIHHHRQGGVEAQPHAGSTPSLAHVSKSFQPDARRACTEMGSVAWGELVPYLKMVSLPTLHFSQFLSHPESSFPSTWWWLGRDKGKVPIDHLPFLTPAGLNYVLCFTLRRNLAAPLTLYTPLPCATSSVKWGMH